MISKKLIKNVFLKIKTKIKFNKTDIQLEIK